MNDIQEETIQKKTLIVGASPNPARYAYMAAQALTENGFCIVPIGIKKGKVAAIDILNIRQKPKVEGIHTITMYIGIRHQPEWYEYLVGLQPQRIIFNPGTENPEFQSMAISKGIETLNACTLIMLNVGNY